MGPPTSSLNGAVWPTAMVAQDMADEQVRQSVATALRTLQPGSDP